MPFLNSDFHIDYDRSNRTADLVENAGCIGLEMQINSPVDTGIDYGVLL